MPKALEIRHSTESIGAEEFQGNESFQPLLPGAVNNRHAASPDFFQQLVVSKRTGLRFFQRHCGREGFPGQRRGDECGLGCFSQRCCERPHSVLIGEKLFQLGGIFRITGQPFLPIGRLARLQNFKPVRKKLAEPFFPVVESFCGVIHYASAWGSSSNCRSFFMARSRSAPMAPLLRFSSCAISARGQPCR